MTRTNTLAGVGAAAVLYLAATLLVMHVIQPQMNPGTHYVSEYAHGEFGWLVMAGYVVAGLGALAIAGSALSTLSGRWSPAVAVCLGLVGLGLVASGLTRIDVAQANGTVVSTASGMAHELAGYVMFLGLIPGAFILSGAFRRDPRLVGASFAARLFAWGLVITLVLAIAVFQRVELVGVGQRVFLVAWQSWLVFVALQLWMAGRLTAPASSAEPA
jgi:hypothetical protein